MGKAIVSTSIGCEGLAAVDALNVVLAAALVLQWTRSRFAAAATALLWLIFPGYTLNLVRGYPEPLVVLCFWIGVYPKPFLAFLHVPMAHVANIVQPGRFGSGVAQAASQLPVTPVVEPTIIPETAGPGRP